MKKTIKKKGYVKYSKNKKEVIVKLGKGKASKYKKKKGWKLNDYLMLRLSKEKVTKGSDPKSFLEKIRTRPILNQYIKKGKSEVLIQDIKKLDRRKTRDKYKELLKPLVKDETLLNILALNENIAKYKSRLKVEIIIKGRELIEYKEGESNREFKLITYNKDIDEIKEALKHVLRRNSLWRNDLFMLKESGILAERETKYDVSKPIVENIEKISVKVIYKKGK